MPDTLLGAGDANKPVFVLISTIWAEGLSTRQVKNLNIRPQEGFWESSTETSIRER